MKLKIGSSASRIEGRPNLSAIKGISAPEEEEEDDDDDDDDEEEEG
jgi:hypothetical protein